MNTCPHCHAAVKDDELFCANCGTRLISQQMQEHAIAVAAVWPDWHLEKELGKGSYGVVYQASRTDSTLQSHAAIKIISIPSNSGEVSSLRLEGLDESATRTYFKELTDEFVREIQVMESFKGVQNIVSVEDYKVVEHKDNICFDIFIRMELLTPFVDHACNQILTEDKIAALGCDICSALELCNREQVIHRDIKPENIFINHFGHYKLGDFGIARTLENSTNGLSQKGTYNYMAPEVVSSSDYDHRVDRYSLGMVLYRLLNNNLPPFLTAENRLNPAARKLALDRRLKGDPLPPPANASPQMAAVILKACAFHAENRYASATAMKQALLLLKNKSQDKKAVGATPLPTSPMPIKEAVADPVDKTVSVRTTKKTAPPPQPKPTMPSKAVSSFDESSKKKKTKGSSLFLKTLLRVGALLIIAGLVLLCFNINNMVNILTDDTYAEGTIDQENGIYENRWAGISFEFADYQCGTDEDYRQKNTGMYTCVLYVQNATETKKLTIGYEELTFGEYLFKTEQEYAASAIYAKSLHDTDDSRQVEYYEETLCGEDYTVAKTTVTYSYDNSYTEMMYVRKHQGYMICIVATATSSEEISQMLQDFSTP